jgi:hypothetical protein
MQLKYTYYFFAVLGCLVSHQTGATVYGSDNAIQAGLSYFSFPSGQSNNRLATYGLASTGFGLADSSTSALFDSIFPVSGSINLNGGTLTLNKDLIFNNGTTLQGLGFIIGQNHVMELSYNTNSLPINTVYFQDTTLVLNNDVTISSAITFSGICYVQGNGHELILGNNSAIKVGNNSTLLIRDTIINGVQANNVRCLNDYGLLILDNSTWIQTADSSYLIGALQFRKNVTMSGDAIFSYQTLRTSLVESESTLMLDTGFTFSYDPIRLASKTLLQFKDDTATLFLNGATLHATNAGLNLTRGSLMVRGASVLASETKSVGGTLIDEGITFGDGLSEQSDFATTILAGATLKFAAGSINYKNVLAHSWFMENSVSQLNMGDFTTLRLYQSLNLGFGTALCNQDVTIARVAEAKLLGSISAVANLFFEQL